MTVTRTIGPTGNHVDINAWVAYVVANWVTTGALTDHQVGNIQAAGITVTAQQSITGWVPGASNFTTTLGADGGGIAPYGGQSTALYYNTVNGYFVDADIVSASLIKVSVQRFTIQDIQCRGRQPGSTPDYGAPALDTSGVSTGVLPVAQRCIFDSQTVLSPASAVVWHLGITMNNCLVVQHDNNIAAGAVASTAGGTATVQDCTFVGTGSSATAVGNHNYDVTVSTGCAYINWLHEAGHNPSSITGDHNATTNASMTDQTGAAIFTSSQVSLVVTTEFQSAIDFRLKSTSVKCKDNGVTISGIGADIVGTTRPQGATPDIGAWEFVQAGGYVPYNPWPLWMPLLAQ